MFNSPIKLTVEEAVQITNKLTKTNKAVEVKIKPVIKPETKSETVVTQVDPKPTETAKVVQDITEQTTKNLIAKRDLLLFREEEQQKLRGKLQIINTEIKTLKKELAKSSVLQKLYGLALKSGETPGASFEEVISRADDQSLLAAIICDKARKRDWASLDWATWEKQGRLTKQVFLEKDNEGNIALYWLLRHCPESKFYFANCFTEFNEAELTLIENQSQCSRTAITFTERIREMIVPEYKTISDNTVYRMDVDDDDGKGVTRQLVLVNYSAYAYSWGWRVRKLNGRLVIHGLSRKSELLEFMKDEKAEFVDVYKNGTDTRWMPGME